MKEPIKVGDRVRCCGQPECGSFPCPTIEGDYGTVRGFDPQGWAQVHLDSDYGKEIFVYHPQQLRKLRPRRVAREWWSWVSDQDELIGPVVDEHSPNRTYTQVRVREILPPRKGGAK